MNAKRCKRMRRTCKAIADVTGDDWKFLYKHFKKEYKKRNKC